MLHIMQPSQGRIVIVSGDAVRSNGCDTAPAVVTRTWGRNNDGSYTINALAFPDATMPVAVTSVRLYADETAVARAREALAEHARESITIAHWPSRV